MKTLLIMFLFICSSLFCEAQTYNSSCMPSGNMELIYHNDACRLALIRMQEIVSPFADSVIIPAAFIDSIEKALFAVDNMQNALVYDTLRGIFGHINFIPGSDSTHIFSASNGFGNAFSLKQVMVIVDNNTAWGKQWLLGNYSDSGNDSVNYLINKHHLEVTLNVYQLYPTRTMYVINSPFAINAAALAKQFENLSGVGNGNAYAITSFLGNIGNTIQAIFINGDIQLSYSFGCGDCPSGCTLGRIWKFRVHVVADCSVDYLSVESWGNHLQWLSGACLDYRETRVLCPSVNSATLFNLISGTTYQWQVSVDGTTFIDIKDDDNYTGTNTTTLTLNNIPSSSLQQFRLTNNIWIITKRVTQMLKKNGNYSGGR